MYSISSLYLGILAVVQIQQQSCKPIRYTQIYTFLYALFAYEKERKEKDKKGTHKHRH